MVNIQAGLNKLGGWFWKGQFSSIEFDDYFPTAGNAEIDDAVRIDDNVANGLGKLGVVGHPPEHGMGIEDGFHRLMKISRVEKSI